MRLHGVRKMASSPEHPLDAGPAAAVEGAGPDVRAWMAQYGPGLRRYFLKRVAVAEADDLVQDVFLALQARRPASDIDNVEGYLFRTAVNVLARRRRRAARQWSLQQPLDEAQDPRDDLSPERILMGKEAVGRMIAVLNELPPRTAEAFFLSRFEHMTYDAVARRMGISVKAVEDLMRRALQRLIQQVEPDL